MISKNLFLKLFAAILVSLGLGMFLSTYAVQAAGTQKIILANTTGAHFGLDSGNITSDPAGINCGSGGDQCSADFPAGTVVTLTSKGNPGKRIGSWSTSDLHGCNNSASIFHASGQIFSGNPCVVDLGRNGDTKDVGLWLDYYATEGRLEVIKMGTGSGRLVNATGAIDCGKKCTATIPTNVSQVYTAIPDKGSMFLRWDNRGTLCWKTVTFELVHGVCNQSRTDPYGGLNTLRPVFNKIETTGATTKSKTDASKPIENSEDGMTALETDDHTYLPKSVTTSQSAHKWTVLDRLIVGLIFAVAIGLYAWYQRFLKSLTRR